MAELPSANVTINDEAGAFAGTTGLLVVLACVALNADITPRFYASAQGLFEQHGYSQGTDFASHFIRDTKKPVLFIGLPIATAGAVVDDDAGVEGTSVAAAVADTGGVLEETVGKLTVVKGGTIGTGPIEFDLTLDGGRTTKRVRLGTATSYVIPYVGIKLTFGAGTLLVGDVLEWESSAPMWDAAGAEAARAALAAQQKQARAWLGIGDVPNAALASAVATAINEYQTSNDRFAQVRLQVYDRSTGQTMAAYVAAADTAFSSIDAQRRVELVLGRARKPSPITGWNFRRPASWPVTIREYQHDVHIPTWRKVDGPLLGWSLEDEDGNIVEYDERVHGGALAARFTCLRTWSNGPEGAYVAMAMTRAPDASLLSRSHNMAVVNVACTIAQLETEMAIGQSLVLQDSGKATDQSLATIEGRVNTSLEQGVLTNVQGEGQRASMATWVASRNDVLNVPGARLNGVLTLLINGTLEHINTTVSIPTNG